METILLFIIVVLLIGDLYFLNRIYKKGKKGIEIALDEKYFELKYNINLLKAISAILIFVIGYLGYSSYKEFTDKIINNFNDTIKSKTIEIQEISKRTDKIKTSVDSLEILKNSLGDIVVSYESKLQDLNHKISIINNSFKYNQRIYVVNDLKFYNANFDSTGLLKIYFKDLKTIFGEQLPIFSKPPLINVQVISVQGLSIFIDVFNVTTTSVEFRSGAGVSYGPDDNNLINGYYKFDIWIASFD